MPTSKRRVTCIMNATPSTELAYLASENGIATITLNRPESSNSINLELARLLRRLAAQVESQEDIRVLIIQGKGQSFCVGADVRMFAENLDDAECIVRQILAELHKFICCLKHMGKIVIMSVHGSIAGGGLSLLSHGDMCIAAEDALFFPAYSRLGLSPDMGATFSFGKIIGIKRSLQIFLHDDHFDAHQALDWGLVNWVVPRDQLGSKTKRIADQVAMKAPAAIAATKRLFVHSDDQSLETQMMDEMEAIVTCAGYEAFKSAVKKMVQKDR